MRGQWSCEFDFRALLGSVSDWASLTSVSMWASIIVDS